MIFAMPFLQRMMMLRFFLTPIRIWMGNTGLIFPDLSNPAFARLGLCKVTDLGIDTYGESSGLFSHRHANTHGIA